MNLAMDRSGVRSRLPKLGPALWLMLVVVLGLAAVPVLPRALHAGRELAAQDDPSRLSDLALDGRFDREVAAREIDAALAANDPQLAQSFLDLANERAVPVDAERAEKVVAATAKYNSATSTAGRFVHGLVTGETDSGAAFAGTALGDLFVFGDVRDAAQQGIRAAQGNEVDRTVLGLALAGIAVTAGTYATLGAAIPERLGLSVMKAAAKTGRIGERLLPRLVRLERTENVLRAAGDLGRVERKAGMRAALDGVKLAEEPKDLSRLARLAAAKGGKTRAVLKLLGRGAIALTASLVELASWVLWAVAQLFALVIVLKRMAERAAFCAIRRRKRRRQRLGARMPPNYGRRRLATAKWLGGRRVSVVRRRPEIAPVSAVRA
jgi:hypothetical protein